MSGTHDISRELSEAVARAADARRPVNLVGGNSKAFLGHAPEGAPLDVSRHCGVVSYEPVELVLTARAGTRMTEIDSVLSAAGQMLAFEPPHFGDGATLGGTIACGLSGPRRPYAGAARDYVLGARIINGRGEILKFGGEVMKNVAGYDVSRLMTGAMGTLGVLLEISLKVLPRPAAEVTLVQARPLDEALRTMTKLAAGSLPLSAACYDGEHLHLRLSGADSAVEYARRQIGGEVLADGAGYWRRVREHRHGFFDAPQPLWRISVPANAAVLDVPGRWFIDWGGAQRWLTTDATATEIRRAAAAAGGHATRYRGGDRSADFIHPLPETLMALQCELKRAFDPHGILNPRRLFSEF